MVSQLLSCIGNGIASSQLCANPIRLGLSLLCSKIHLAGDFLPVVPLNAKHLDLIFLQNYDK